MISLSLLLCRHYSSTTTSLPFHYDAIIPSTLTLLPLHYGVIIHSTMTYQRSITRHNCRQKSKLRSNGVMTTSSRVCSIAKSLRHIWKLVNIRGTMVRISGIRGYEYPGYEGMNIRGTMVWISGRIDSYTLLNVRTYLSPIAAEVLRTCPYPMLVAWVYVINGDVVLALVPFF